MLSIWWAPSLRPCRLCCQQVAVTSIHERQSYTIGSSGFGAEDAQPLASLGKPWQALMSHRAWGSSRLVKAYQGLLRAVHRRPQTPQIQSCKIAFHESIQKTHSYFRPRIVLQGSSVFRCFGNLCGVGPLLMGSAASIRQALNNYIKCSNIRCPMIEHASLHSKLHGCMFWITKVLVLLHV
jgi:hypothetical protein